MYRICKAFTLETAHQLDTAVTADCHRCIHGHSYKVEIYVASASLDHHRMVTDFANLKPAIDRIRALYDHGLLLSTKNRKHFNPLIENGILHPAKVHFFDEQPTAEVFARILFGIVREEIEDRPGVGQVFYVEKVRVSETGTSWAEFEGGDN